MNKKVFSIVVSIIGVAAVVFANTASAFWTNKPEAPKSLLKK